MEKLEEAIKVITSDWENLYNKQKERWSYSGLVNKILVVAESDNSADYEVDVELIGISSDGNIFWAYASGCSCWEGDYTEETKPTVKEFGLVHDHTPEEWQDMIIKFAETKEVQKL